MTLLIDIGNTRVKFALWDGEHIMVTDSMPNGMDDIDNALISSVGPVHPEIEEAVKDKQIRRLTWQTPEAREIITNMPQGLGSDRIASDIAAINLTDEDDATVLIIDAGTCLTFDVLSINRIRMNGKEVRTAKILGGSISPGICMRLKSMHEHTNALPTVSENGPSPLLGTDTETAMRSGATLGLKYEIEGYIRNMKEKFPNLKVFMAGGNGINEPNVTVDPLLVFKGLLKIYNP